MKLHQLNITKTKTAKRAGRGISAGRGKTAGRGTKGQKSRTGGNIPSYFEGGQNPLVHRLPKQKGFKSRRRKAQVIHTDQLNQFKGPKIVTGAELAQAGLITNSASVVKLLARGPLTTAIKLEVHSASRAAQEMVAKAKGQVIIKPRKPPAKVKAKTTPDK